MTFRVFCVRIAAFAVLAAGIVCTASQPVMAQGFFRALFGADNRPTPRHEDSFVAKYSPGTIVVSFGDRRLYYVSAPGRAISYPIAVPTPEAMWSGVLRVTAKRVNPVWTPTASMRKENPELPASVPGGHPMNPLGVRALYLGDTLYRIHGTDAPWTIGQVVSRGCIRLYNEDVIDLYARVDVGTKVVITSERFVAH